MYVMNKLLSVLSLLPCLVLCKSHLRSKTEPTMSVIALPVILLATVPFRMLIYRYDLRVPQRLFWVPHAIVYAALVHRARIDNSFKAFLDLDWTYLIPPKWLVGIYFPAACFRMAFKMDLHILKRSYFQIFFLTVVGGVLNIFMMGALMKYTLNTNWTMAMGMLFGSISTITEAAHGSQVINEMDKYKHLITLMEGESLIGTALSTTLLELTVAITENILSEWYHVILFLIRQVGVAIAFGLCIGYFGRYIILHMHNDKFSVVGIPFLCTYVAYYVTVISGGSGALASVVVCLKISAERARYGNDVGQLIDTFWESMMHLAMPYFFVAILGICFERLYDIAHHDFSELAHAAVLYFMFNVTRIIGFLIISPVVSRTGYGVDFKSIVFIMWAPQKSIVSLICALSIFHDLRLQEISVEVIGNVTVLFVLTLAVNANTVPLLLNFLGFKEISIMKRTNMNNCMKYIMDKRRHVISLLKMNRFLSDANWPLVLDITRLKHPYKLNSASKNDEQGEDDFLGDSRASYCVECDQVVQIDPSPKEYAEMTKEARLRVLKSEKISYIRQYEKGLLSQEGLRSLLQAVEVALDSHDLIIKLDDYFRTIRKRNFYDILKKCVTRLTRKVARAKLKPKTKFRRRCYAISHHSYFTLACMLVILIHVILEVLYFALEATWQLKNQNVVVHLVNLLVICFELLYLSRIVIKVLGLSYLYVTQGLMLYFKEFINILDFGSFIVKSCCAVGMTTIFIEDGRLRSSSWDAIHNFYYYIVIFKTLQCIAIILNLGPKIIRMCDKNYDSRIAYAYEIGHCLVNGYGEVSEMLVQMVRNKKIRETIHKNLDADRLAITRELGLMHKFSPWIAVSTKTRQAIKATLNHLNQTVEELKTSGFVDDYEYGKLQDSIEDRMRVARNLKTVQLSSPKALFKELQWLQSEKIADYLYENSSTRVWDAGNIICENGRISDGVFVLVTGLFKLEYKPNPDFIEMQKETGILPVVDYLASAKFDETMQDYIFAGNSIGELCVLTQRPYNCTIVAEVPSQAFVLSHRLLLSSTSHDTDPTQGLECRLWKYVSINIGVSLLQETSAYQSYTQDQIRLMLEKAFLPNLKAYKVMKIHQNVHDIILIDGIVYDMANAEPYIAPCYIPKTVQSITIHKNKNYSNNVKLMILPVKDVDEYELMDILEDLAELDTDASDSDIINVQRLREKKALPLFQRRRSSLIRKAREMGLYSRFSDSDQDILSSSNTMSMTAIADNDRDSREDPSMYSTAQPLSMHDISYRNKQISTLAVRHGDEGYSKAKVNSGTTTVLSDAEFFAQRKIKLNSSNRDNSDSQFMSPEEFEEASVRYTTSKMRFRNASRKQGKSHDQKNDDDEDDESHDGPVE